MGLKEQDSYSAGVISTTTRWLAIVTGCFLFGSTFVLGWGSLVESSFLILGAIVQPRSIWPGRWLMWVCAVSMSIEAGQVGIIVLREAIESQRSYHNNVLMSLPIMAILLALALVLCCDVALVIDALAARRSHAVLTQPRRRNLDWLVWIAALALSVYYVWMSVLAVRSYRLYGRLDILVTGVVAASVVLFFDVALIVHAFRSMAQRAERTEVA